MSLITVVNLQAYTDKLAQTYKRFLSGIGDPANVLAPVVGTDQYIISNLLGLLVAIPDFQQQQDLSINAYNVLQKTDRKNIFLSLAKSLVDQLDNHCSTRGPSVSGSIQSLATYLAYYNGGVGGNAFSSLLNPIFGDLYYDMEKTRLPSVGLFQPGIHPLLNAAYTNGMATKTVSGTFTAGQAYESTPLYAEVAPLLEYTTDFASGSAPPTFTVAGTDNLGGTSVTWTATGGSNNPTAALSTTITPAVNQMSRQVVAVASASGIVPGSVLTVNSGLVDQENIIVEVVSGSNITAYFNLAHLSGAALTGNKALALVPGTSGHRLRSVSGITIGITSHSAGTVRIIGIQDRGYHPDVV